MARKSAKLPTKVSSSDLSSPPEPARSTPEVAPITPRSKKRKRAGDATGGLTKVQVTEEAHITANGTSSSSKRVTKTAKGASVEAVELTPTTPRSSRKRKAVSYAEETEPQPETTPNTKASNHKKVKVEQERAITSTATAPTVDDKPSAEAQATTKKRRKTKEEKAAEAMPLAPRTQAHKFFIGAHVSSAGGVHNAVTNAAHIGANAFALFLKSQRKWANPDLADDVVGQWHGQCDKHVYSPSQHIVPHGSYLVNLAHTDPERTKQAYEGFIDDLKRCERLGIKLYNFHPGNVQGVSRSEAIKHLAGNLNRAHKETKSVVTLLENMAAGGNVIGTTFQDLADVISAVEDKSRVGICLDTCHAFAAGYDLRTKAALDNTLAELDKIVGLKYLRALHLNDSKAPYRSNRDLHANIGTGFLGLRAFHAIMNEPRFHGLPIVLETPIEVYDDDGNPVKDEKGKDTKEDKGIWAREIKMLEGFANMDAESKEFTELEETLAARGQKERARVQDQVDRTGEKAKGAQAKKGKGKKGKKVDTSDSENGDLD